MESPTKYVFVDCEYTGLHAATTLVSAGFVTLPGEELYLVLNDYDAKQVTPWVRENVLVHLDERAAVSRREACARLAAFLESYSQGLPVSLVSAGKSLDLILVCQLWDTMPRATEFFHFHEGLPAYLNHRGHVDLDTLFLAAGIDPNVDRYDFLRIPRDGRRHNALHDAEIVRSCFLSLLDREPLRRFKAYASSLRQA
ncbi:MAG: 3'-5' exoribonuclease [Candidatus Eisenbacteria sp.]|nr:3'-5' exoribonuclease [Candidatus Eisenbacteria bacterium]